MPTEIDVRVPTYPKIETLFNRNPEDMKKVIVGQYRDESFSLVDKWLVTEKIDGTNVRVILDGDTGNVRFGGRTDDAQMPLFLLDKLTELFSGGVVASAFDEGTSAVLFGEGYGPKIQKGGGDYAPSASFILFDVAVLTPTRVWWLNWHDVLDVSNKLNIPTVPIIAESTSTAEAIELVSIPSLTCAENGIDRQQEGVVCRTDPLLFTRRGDRLMWKLKGRDL